MTTNNGLKLRCKCEQSKLSIAANTPILGRFVCHCKICQSVYKAPYADFVVLNAKHVKIEDNACLEFNKHRLPPALQRGVCRECDTPTVAFLRLMPFLRLAFIPSKLFKEPNTLPEIKAHIFYHSRQEDVNDELPKLEGYWKSELAVSHQVIKALLS